MTGSRLAVGCMRVTRALQVWASRERFLGVRRRAGTVQRRR